MTSKLPKSMFLNISTIFFLNLVVNFWSVIKFLIFQFEFKLNYFFQIKGCEIWLLCRSPRAWGPQWTLMTPPAHLNPVKQTWALILIHEIAAVCESTDRSSWRPSSGPVRFKNFQISNLQIFLFNDVIVLLKIDRRSAPSHFTPNDQHGRMPFCE